MITGHEPLTDGLLQRGANVHVGYFSQEQESLDWDLRLWTRCRIADWARPEARTFLHLMLFPGTMSLFPWAT